MWLCWEGTKGVLMAVDSEYVDDLLGYLCIFQHSISLIRESFDWVEFG